MSAANTPPPEKRRAPLWSAAWSSYWPEVIILLAYATVRLVALTDSLPVFIDEATMIARARDMLRGYTFEPVEHGAKWLLVALVALLRPTGPEALWLARSLTALLATVSCAAAIGLGRLLDSRLAGRLAGLLTVLAPLAVFFERQALADPLMAVFANLTLVLVVLMVRTGRWRYALPAALTIALAAISKLTGLLFLVLPGAGALLLRSRAARKDRLVLQAALATLLAFVLTAGFIVYADTHVEPDARLLIGRQGESSLWCRHAGWCEEGESSPGTPWKTSARLKLYPGIQSYYLGLPMLTLAALGGALLLLDRRRRAAVSFLAVPGFSLALALVMVSSWYTTRYFNFTVASLAVLAAMALAGLERLARRLVGDLLAWRRATVALPGVLVVAALAWQLPADLAWLRSPHTASLPPPEWSGCNGYGYGYDRVAETMSAWIEDNGGRASVVVRDAASMGAYWGERVGGVRKWRKSSDDLRVAMAAWLVRGKAIFFADRFPSKEIPAAPYGATLEMVESFPLPCGDDIIRLRRMVDEGPELRRAIYELTFPNPNEFEEQYHALALYLIESGAEGVVVVYPPNQLDLLASRLQWGTALEGVQAVGDSWPLDREATADSLASLAAQHGEVWAVLLEEKEGEGESFVRAWLDEHMRLVSQEWFGPVELLHYTAN